MVNVRNRAAERNPNPTHDRTTATYPVVRVTELTPANTNRDAAKVIFEDGTIKSEPPITEWRWKQIEIRSPLDLFDQIRFKQGYNVCLIRNAPQATTPEIAYRRMAPEWPTGFTDQPVAFFVLDFDGVQLPPGIDWQRDAEAAVNWTVARLGEPFRDVSFTWQLTATCGLEKDAQKKWTGRLLTDVLRMRAYFLTDRAINSEQHKNWTKLLKVAVPELDLSISHRVQVIYTAAPRFATYRPDPIPQRVGFIQGGRDRVTVPDDLEQQIRWVAAEGAGQLVWAEHPDLRAAVAAIGTPLPGTTDGTLYPHLRAAARYLVRENPRSASMPIPAYAAEMTAAFRRLIERHMGVIAANLLRHNRSKSELLDYLNNDAERLIKWLAEHPNAQHTRETVRRGRGKRRSRIPETAKAIFAQDLIPGVNRKPTGSGKSTALRRFAVSAAQQAGKGQVVVIAVPRHKLSEEQIALFEREYPNSRLRYGVWRGRQADDPQQPDKKMCWRHEEAQALEKVSLKVDSTLCQRGELRCPLFDQCGYQRQKQRANIWLVAHESLVHEKPKIIGEVIELLIDEDMLDALLWFDDIALDDIGQPAQHGEHPQILTTTRAQLTEALRDLPDGHVPKSALHVFRHGWAAKQIKYEWAQKIEPDITPRMSKREVERAAATASGNALMRKRIRLWQVIDRALADDAPELCGRLRLTTAPDGERVVKMCGLAAVKREFGRLRYLTDATADPLLLRYGSPHLQASRVLFPLMPHVRFRQLVTDANAKTSIAIEGDGAEDRKGTVKRRWAALLTDATRRYGGQAVVCVTYKSTEDYIRENLYVPPWLALAHFGGVSGTDQFKDVRALYVMGRPLPNAEQVTAMAEALTGEAILQRDYIKTEAPIFYAPPDADGRNVVWVKQRRHPHPVAERLRRVITEGGLMQTIGRVRGMWRRADNPVDVNVWTNVPLQDFEGPYQTPFDINEPVEAMLWHDLKPGPEELMLALGGVWLKSAKDAQTAYPGGIVESSLKDARRVRIPYSNLITGNPYSPPTTRDTLPAIQEVPGALTVHYRREGKGRKPSVAVFLPGGFNWRTARAWLEERLGPLAEFKVTRVRRRIG